VAIAKFNRIGDLINVINKQELIIKNALELKRTLNAVITGNSKEGIKTEKIIPKIEDNIRAANIFFIYFKLIIINILIKRYKIFLI
jgi:hypothetical protein